MTPKTSVEKKSSAEKKQKRKQQDAEVIRRLEQEIQRLQEEVQQKHHQLLRSLADFQNLQKRIEKERALHEESIKEKYISQLIDIQELLQKAYQDEHPKDGLRLVLQQLDQFFDQEHIQPIECIGKPFDVRKHHAVTTIVKEDCEDNIVIEEIKKGYMVDEKVLRPSRVVVAKKKAYIK